MTIGKLKAVAIALAAAGGVAAVLLATNPAPPVDEGTWDARATTPIVVKLHARWCPVCMATKDVWASVATEYAGRVRFVVFDFTSNAATTASRARARAAGLEPLFDDYIGETGTVLVLDGGSHDVKYRLHGDREIGHYRDAIDSALKSGM
jgi:thiol-disulfide isomerase/thioredoxin